MNQLVQRVRYACPKPSCGFELLSLLTDVDTEETGRQQKPRLDSVQTPETANSIEEVDFKPIREATR